MWAASQPWLLGQTNVLTVGTPPKAHIKRGEPVTVKLQVQLAEGYHVNSNTPSEDYLIPLKLTWETALLGPSEVVYPKPALEKYDFTEKPISVVTGDFAIETKFKAPTAAAQGPNIVIGKLRYQACNQRMCLPPKTVEVRLPVEVH
jgi:thioredoxin:protein disulfide reductase